MKVFYGFIASFVIVSATASASSIAYEQSHEDRFEPVATIDSESLMQANDKEYLVQKTANLVDLFYETGIPKRIAKLVRVSGVALDNNRSNDPMFTEVNEIFGKSLLNSLISAYLKVKDKN